ncbi:uncharacterized protein MELLADRAFT_77850 [Melampsora larici-populina 98AG31]|uniref:OTU domain-containing protein n=1 Tax=Melampsora larici-populina (strain 98AG31 / pathotype 3-4-7) TaxID=747676 RepID=F4RML1_MELLP|nr:uncharacterized protein MELLADRAFT_77850 [Melampsora larici-populina 98AG31]EGG06439.1 hypothetical protein MELLADRAFT_77850 [Melampsora larici-populina 98AG31]
MLTHLLNLGRILDIHQHQPGILRARPNAKSRSHTTIETIFALFTCSIAKTQSRNLGEQTFYFFGISENTNSTFNLEELIFQPNIKIQEDNPSPPLTQDIDSLLGSTTIEADIGDHTATLEPKPPTLQLSQTTEAAKPPPKTTAPPAVERIITRKRAREQAQTDSNVCNTDEVAKPPLATKTSLSKPIRRITRQVTHEEAVAQSLPGAAAQTLKDSTHPGQALRQKNHARIARDPRTTLSVLLKKYQIHDWLKPFILNLNEVDSDGHCGFRAIAVSIGRPQDDWLYIRQSLVKTLKRLPHIFPDSRLPEERAKLLDRLQTEEPNVLSSNKHWLSMPGIGGVIATTFDRPVLYYEPGHSSQVVFPYLTPINDNTPIFLVWAKCHFASLTLDYKNPKLPVPRVCQTWNRFRSLMASTWLPAYQPMIEQHAAVLAATQNISKGKKKRVLAPISIDGSDA